MSTLMSDIRYGLRMLAKRPGFTMTAAVVLALGIGANTALFSIIHSVLLSPLPFASPERIAMLQSAWTNSSSRNAVSGPDYLDWAERNTVFEEFGAFSIGRMSLSGSGEPVSLKTFHATSSFFRLFPEKIALGQREWPRVRSASDPNVAVLTHSLWQDRYHADPNIIGRVVMLDEKPHIVVAVTAPLMGFIEDMVEVFVPFRANLMVSHPRDAHYLTVLGRLKPDISFDQAQAQMNQLCALIEREQVETNQNKRASVQPLHDSIVATVRTAFFVLYGAVTFLLVIACLNVSNLLVAKAATRRREMAIRRALGAGRGRLFRQLLTESLLLGLLGGLLGLLVAQVSLNLLRWIAPAGIPGLAEIGLNGPVLWFTLVLALVASIVFGLLPAWQGAFQGVHTALKETAGQVSRTRGRRQTLGVLVAGQIAMALILLAGAGLLIKSFTKLQLANPGFDAEGILAINLVRPGTSQNQDVEQRKQFFERVTEKLATLPGVETSAAIDIWPLQNRGNTADLKMVGREDKLTAEIRVITPDYFTCMNIPLRRGRAVRFDDGREGIHVAVVNEEFVRLHLGGQDPLGLEFECWDQKNTIVGVVGNVKLKSLREQGFAPMAYLPMAQHCGWDMTVLLRSGKDPLRLAQNARQAIWNMDPGQPIMNMSTMNQLVKQSFSVERFCTMVLTMMAGVALLMALVGLYGVMSFAVNERRNEVGIRMALGAGDRDILTLVAKRALILTIIGLGIGVVGALIVSRFMSSMLYDISSHDIATFVLVPMLLFGVAMLACYFPARRATRLDPMKTLRYE